MRCARNPLAARRKTGRCQRETALASLCAEVRGFHSFRVSNVSDCQSRLSRNSEAMEVKAIYGITGEH